MLEFYPFHGSKSRYFKPQYGSKWARICTFLHYRDRDRLIEPVSVSVLDSVSITTLLCINRPKFLKNGRIYAIFGRIHQKMVLL
jgi:hypothetical protein